MFFCIFVKNYIVLDFTHTEFRDVKFTWGEFPSVKTVFRSYPIVANRRNAKC